MHNDNIDFDSLKKIKHFNPLFQNCFKALSPSQQIQSSQYVLSSDQKKTFSYIGIDGNIQLPQKLFQCKSLCPIFTSAGSSYVLVKGQNLWDFYRAKKQHDIILTEQQVWILLEKIVSALIQLSQYGYIHTHLKQYAIYRQSAYSYQLIFHPQIKSMLQLTQNNKFYWYEFYMSPQQLKAKSKEKYVHSDKDDVFSLGLLVLNVLNSQDFNRDVYSRKNYEVDWEIVKQKLHNCRKKYSGRLVNLVQNCLKEFAQQRYNFKMVYAECGRYFNENRNLNLQFQSKINELISSRIRSSQIRKSPTSIKSSESFKNQNKPRSISAFSVYTQRKEKDKKSPSSKDGPPSQKSRNSSDEKNTLIQKVPQSASKQKFSYQSPQVKKWRDNIYPHHITNSAPINQLKGKTQPSNQQVKEVIETAQQKNTQFPKNQLYSSTSNRKDQVPKSNKNIQHLKIQIRKDDKQQDKQNKAGKLYEEISFERGTFGGEIQSPKFQSFINKLKKQTYSASQQPNINKSWENHLPVEISHNSVNKPPFISQQPYLNATGPSFNATGSSFNLTGSFSNATGYVLSAEEQQFQKTKLVTFGSLHNGKTQVEISATTHPQKQALIKNKQSHIVKDLVAQKHSLEEVRKQQAQFAASYFSIQKMKQFLKQNSKIIKMELNNCLQPIVLLQKQVSSTPGVYIEGNLYYGQFKSGRRNGLGLQIFPESQYYFGNFKDDLFHGQGFYFWNKNQYFIGIFLNGRKVFGNLYGPKLFYQGQFKSSKKMNGIGKATHNSGQTYTGIWKEGKKHGLGQKTQITRDKMVAYWEKGKINGYAEHMSSSFPEQGQKIKAIWKNQQIISDVIIQYANGNTYEGGLNGFQKHGKGEYKFKKGGHFKGTFYKDEATHGQLVYKNGERYYGSLKNMRRHGFGQYYYLDGSIKKGNWIDDVRVQKLVQPKMSQ